MRKINKIVIHCSDSDHAHHDDIEVIRGWHVNERRWPDVGYHFFIKRNGDIQEGRALSVAGAHVRGHNEDSIGICLHGKTTFTDSQFKALRQLVAKLYFEFKLSINNVYGHCDFDQNKSCPNFPYKAILSTGMFNDPKTEKRV